MAEAVQRAQALAGPDDEFWLRAALGASAGLLGGWSFAVVFTSPATGNSESALAGRKRALALGGAVGLAGGVAGIGAGAATRNYTEDFGLRKAALFTLGGGLVGTLTGSVIGLSGQDRGGVE